MEENGLSVADALALRGNNGNSGDLSNGGWWIIILLIFLMGGFGGRGWGNGDGGTNTVVVPAGNGWGNTSPCSVPASIQGMTDAFNFSALSTGIAATHDSVIDGFYQNNLATTGLGTAIQTSFGQAALQNCQGFNNVANTINQGVNNIQSSLCNGFNNVQAALANCCCENREAIMQTNFNNQAGFNSVTNAIASNACDIERGQEGIKFLMAQNQSQTMVGIDRLGDRIIDYMNQSKMYELRSELQNAKFQISQQAQTDSIINSLLPTPRPAYITSSPYQAYAANASCACGL